MASTKKTAVAIATILALVSNNPVSAAEPISVESSKYSSFLVKYGLLYRYYRLIHDHHVRNNHGIGH